MRLKYEVVLFFYFYFENKIEIRLTRWRGHGPTRADKDCLTGGHKIIHLNKSFFLHIY